ncbi:hypothetical protein [Verrucomicrobium spinosum]|uniref:hypothetical protein n=1 Tax=Verrucomicrobium spinosum TaxID=2736 RepID=UPI003CCDCE05
MPAAHLLVELFASSAPDPIFRSLPSSPGCASKCSGAQACCHSHGRHGSYARDLLEGIARHQRESSKPWSLHLVRRRRFELPPECLNAWTGDGVIARVDSLEVEVALKRTGLPVVNVSGALENPYFPTFVQDPVLAARLALGCFDERGHRHHAS